MTATKGFIRAQWDELAGHHRLRLGRYIIALWWAAPAWRCACEELGLRARSDEWPSVDAFADDLGEAREWCILRVAARLEEREREDHEAWTDLKAAARALGTGPIGGEVAEIVGEGIARAKAQRRDRLDVDPGDRILFAARDWALSLADARERHTSGEGKGWDDARSARVSLVEVVRSELDRVRHRAAHVAARPAGVGESGGTTLRFGDLRLRCWVDASGAVRCSAQDHGEILDALRGGGS